MIHFVARPGRATELERRLRGLGFTELRALPDGRSVVLAADPRALSERLGIEVAPPARRVAPGRVARNPPSVAASGQLPAAIDELVERWYEALAPDRLGTS